LRLLFLINGGRTRTRTLDPLIKSHQMALIYQAHFDISSVRSGIEPEGKLENVETRFNVFKATENQHNRCPRWGKPLCRSDRW